MYEPGRNIAATVLSYILYKSSYELTSFHAPTVSKTTQECHVQNSFTRRTRLRSWVLRKLLLIQALNLRTRMVPNNRVNALQQALHRPTPIIVTSFNTSGAATNQLGDTKH